jgi:hypothetical protein
VSVQVTLPLDEKHFFKYLLIKILEIKGLFGVELNV